jgi:hypothetical protein
MPRLQSGAAGNGKERGCGRRAFSQSAHTQAYGGAGGKGWHKRQRWQRRRQGRRQGRPAQRRPAAAPCCPNAGSRRGHGKPPAASATRRKQRWPNLLRASSALRASSFSSTRSATRAPILSTTRSATSSTLTPAAQRGSAARGRFFFVSDAHARSAPCAASCAARPRTSQAPLHPSTAPSASTARNAAHGRGGAASAPHGAHIQESWRARAPCQAKPLTAPGGCRPCMASMCSQALSKCVGRGLSLTRLRRARSAPARGARNEEHI